MWIFKKSEQPEDEECPAELDKLRETVLEARMPSQVENVALRELEKLCKTGPSTAEYTIGVNYNVKCQAHQVWLASA